jgi:hypothetical protein
MIGYVVAFYVGATLGWFMFLRSAETSGEGGNYIHGLGAGVVRVGIAAVCGVGGDS